MFLTLVINQTLGKLDEFLEDNALAGFELLCIYCFVLCKRMHDYLLCTHWPAAHDINIPDSAKEVRVDLPV